MTRERYYDEFVDSTGKWKITADVSLSIPTQDLVIGVSFTKKELEHVPINEKDIEILKEDLKDLGKLRLYKKYKKFVED